MGQLRAALMAQHTFSTVTAYRQQLGRIVHGVGPMRASVQLVRHAQEQACANCVRFNTLKLASGKHS